MALALLLVAAGVMVGASSCSTPVANRNPVGEMFPSVSGEALDDAVVRVPESLAGEPAVLLVGYEQDTQFDLDRWLIGLTQLETPVKFLELPTIPGLIPGMFAGTIANGMRSGIPAEMWGGVVTLYGDDAARVVAALGNEKPRCGRVLLLDREGRIAWFFDQGFSPAQLAALDAMARDLAK